MIDFHNVQFHHWDVQAEDFPRYLLNCKIPVTRIGNNLFEFRVRGDLYTFSLYRAFPWGVHMTITIKDKDPLTTWTEGVTLYADEKQNMTVDPPMKVIK